MALRSSLHRGRIRRFVTLGTLVFVAVGMMLLEHTATGASTGRPSHVTTTTAGRNYRHDDKHGDDKHKDDHGHDPGHHETTTTHVTTTTAATTTTTRPVTTTTMRHCDRDHGRHHKHDPHCRPPSGGRDDDHNHKHH